MRGARRLVTYTDDGDREVDYELAETPVFETRRYAAPESSDEELRRLRDLVWLLLKQHGLTPTQISRACSYASRSPKQVHRRLKMIDADPQGALRVG